VIVRSLIVVAVILLAIALLLLIVQDGMIYLPRRYEPLEVKNWRAQGLIELEFETGQGKQGAFYQAPAGSALPGRIWLVFGGNGGRAMDYRDVGSDPDCGFLYVDYPGYGLCEGKPNPRRIDETVDGAIDAMWQALGLEAGSERRRLCVFGHSLGAAVGLRAAGRHRVEQVVLLAPFTSMREMASRVVGSLYANVLRHRFDNIAAMQELQEANPDARVTIFNGSEDREVPPSMGRELAERFGSITEYHALDGVGHNDILDQYLPAVTGAMRGSKESP
jgi:pimeloyl-ACP methyl ester carboxylesterase